MNSITLEPIGTVVSEVTSRMDSKWGEIRSRIVLEEEYRGGLSGLEGFSHALVVTYLHQASYDRAQHLRRRPRNLETMPLLGIFAQRAKNRPNPIGITAVEILGVGEGWIEVKGLDAIHGTPVLDIKPHFPHFDRVSDPKLPEWVERLMHDYFS